MWLLATDSPNAVSRVIRPASSRVYVPPLRTFRSGLAGHPGATELAARPPVHARRIFGMIRRRAAPARRPAPPLPVERRCASGGAMSCPTTCGDAQAAPPAVRPKPGGASIKAGTGVAPPPPMKSAAHTRRPTCLCSAALDPPRPSLIGYSKRPDGKKRAALAARSRSLCRTAAPGQEH